MSSVGPKCWGRSDDVLNGTKRFGDIGVLGCPQWDPDVGGPPTPPQVSPCPSVRPSGVGPQRARTGLCVRGGAAHTRVCVCVRELCTRVRCGGCGVLGAVGRGGGGGAGGGWAVPGDGRALHTRVPRGGPCRAAPTCAGLALLQVLIVTRALGRSHQEVVRVLGGGGDTNGSSPWGQQ